MTDQLTLYNLSLCHMGERQLSSLTEAREPRRVLDTFWTTVAGYCLAQGMWYFAMRASGALPQVAGAYGFAHGYTKPTDLIHLAVMSDQVALFPQVDRDYLNLGPTFYTNTATLYCRYTSNDAAAGGMLLTAWSPAFTAYVSAALARFTCMRIKGDLRMFAELSALEDELYMTCFALESVHMLEGLLPFNATARNPLGNEALQIDTALMPFAAYRRAMARYSAAPQPQQAG